MRLVGDSLEPPRRVFKEALNRFSMGKAYFGTYEISIDNGRFYLPGKIRRVAEERVGRIPENFVLTKSCENLNYMVALDESSLGLVSCNDCSFVSSAWFDGERVYLPSEVTKSLALNKRIGLVGALNSFELWNPDSLAWSDLPALTEENFAIFASRLGI